MIPDALISSSYLLLGCGWCIHRLIKYSLKNSPQFIIASIGIFVIGARSAHSLLYNIFCRRYPIDPRSIAKELARVKTDKNLVNSCLSKVGIASLVYSFYYHYKLFATGAVIVATLTLFEITTFIEESTRKDSEICQTRTPCSEILEFVKNLPLPPATFWIISTELLGRAVGNPYSRLANVPYAMSIWAFPLEGFYQGWSITETINDYLMLCYIILMTEGLCQMRPKH